MASLDAEALFSLAEATSSGGALSPMKTTSSPRSADRPEPAEAFG
jgi:hypothetical protein